VLVYVGLRPPYPQHVLKKKKKKKNSGPKGPGVNEMSFRARPHHNVHCTLGVDT
jgi:hypothetical protein